MTKAKRSHKGKVARLKRRTKDKRRERASKFVIEQKNKKIAFDGQAP